MQRVTERRDTVQMLLLTFPSILLTYKELNIYALLCIDWKKKKEVPDTIMGCLIFLNKTMTNSL